MGYDNGHAVVMGWALMSDAENDFSHDGIPRPPEYVALGRAQRWQQHYTASVAAGDVSLRGHDGLNVLPHLVDRIADNSLREPERGLAEPLVEVSLRLSTSGRRRLVHTVQDSRPYRIV